MNRVVDGLGGLYGVISVSLGQLQRPWCDAGNKGIAQAAVHYVRTHDDRKGPLVRVGVPCDIGTARAVHSNVLSDLIARAADIPTIVQRGPSGTQAGDKGVAQLGLAHRTVVGEVRTTAYRERSLAGLGIADNMDVPAAVQGDASTQIWAGSTHVATRL